MPQPKSPEFPPALAGKSLDRIVSEICSATERRPSVVQRILDEAHFAELLEFASAAAASKPKKPKSKKSK